MMKPEELYADDFEAMGYTIVFSDSSVRDGPGNRWIMTRRTRVSLGAEEIYCGNNDGWLRAAKAHAAKSGRLARYRGLRL
jgi:hypothetical protein